MMTTEDHRGLLNACRQTARKLHTVSGPAARSLVLELHDLLADPRTPPTRLSRVLDDARRIMTEAAQEVGLDRDERAFAMQRMADRVAAKKEAALDEAIREASEAFAKLFVL